MFFQFKRRSDGMFFSGSAKRPKWVESSSVLFGNSGIRSFLGNARNLHRDDIFVEENGNVTRFEDVDVVPVELNHGESTGIIEFCGGSKNAAPNKSLKRAASK